MPRVLLQKAESQVSEKTGKPYTRNVRYDEIGSSYYGMMFVPKRLFQDEGVDPPDQLTVTFE